MKLNKNSVSPTGNQFYLAFSCDDDERLKMNEGM